ncbi:MAG: hypothetical protein ACOX00_02955 [Peptoniphilaceae bacterium]
MKVTAIRVNKKECDALTTKDGRVCGETDKKAGQITLLPQGVREEIDSGVWDRGLCVHRFSENLTVNGLPQLKEGDTLTAGTIGLCVTAAGKSCFASCAYVKENTRCALADAACFASIVRDGTVVCGDRLQVEER